MTTAMHLICGKSTPLAPTHVPPHTVCPRSYSAREIASPFAPALCVAAPGGRPRARVTPILRSGSPRAPRGASLRDLPRDPRIPHHDAVRVHLDIRAERRVLVADDA